MITEIFRSADMQSIFLLFDVYKGSTLEQCTGPTKTANHFFFFVKLWYFSKNIVLKNVLFHLLAILCFPTVDKSQTFPKFPFGWMLALRSLHFSWRTLSRFKELSPLSNPESFSPKLGFYPFSLTRPSGPGQQRVAMSVRLSVCLSIPHAGF